MSSPASSAWFLFDNGSVRAESILSLRRVAASLSARTGLSIQPVSLLHSSNVPSDELDGEPARLLEPALTAFLEKNSAGEVLLIPLFFGPSAALTEYLPSRLASLRTRFPQANVRLAPWLINLADTQDQRIAEALADQVRRVVRANSWDRPNVVLVDHGSPQPGVTDVRNHLGRQLRTLLGDSIDNLVAASMERREGERFAFNDPLLATALRTPPFDSGEVVVALQFLSPGRHAGNQGDIAMICAEAEAERPKLKTCMTAPIATDPRVIAVLMDRLNQAHKA